MPSLLCPNGHPAQNGQTVCLVCGFLIVPRSFSAPDGYPVSPPTVDGPLITRDNG